MAEAEEWEALRREMQAGLHDIAHCIPVLKYLQRRLARFPIQEATSDLAVVTAQLERFLDRMAAVLDDKHGRSQ